MLPFLHETRAITTSGFRSGLSHRTCFRKYHRLSDDSNVASLLWLVNLGCIDLNPCMRECDDVHRPDYCILIWTRWKARHFGVCWRPPYWSEMRCRPCKSGAMRRRRDRGNSCVRSYRTRPGSKASLGLRLRILEGLQQRHPKVVTAEYRVARRLEGAFWWITTRTHGTYAGIRLFSSAKTEGHGFNSVTWKEVERGVEIEDFR